MRLSKAEREAVRLKFDGKCAYCGCDLPERWHADHLEAIIRIAWADALAALKASRSTPQASEDVVRADISGVWAQAEDNHRRYSDTGDRESDIRFLTLGLAGEAGEIANFVKKRWRDGDGHEAAIRLEIADVCAYAFMLANVIGMSPRDLIETIAEKQFVFVGKMELKRAQKPITEEDG